MRAERRITRGLAPALGLAALLTLVAGCHDGPRQAMYDQAKYEPYESSELFDDAGAARVHPEGTVARGHFDPDTGWTTGASAGGAYLTSLPERVVVDRAYLKRGEQRYGIFCAPCHGALGDGDGMIVQRGYYQPASYHEARLQQMPDGYYFDVITQGYGRMPAYASQVPVEDRWAIVAYIRALQLSQNARVGALTGEVGEIARRALADGAADEEGGGEVELMGVDDDREPLLGDGPLDDTAAEAAAEDATEDGE